ncbi:MAG: glycosyltransferase, partial [Tepidisphaeraceae bacterium]
MQQYRLGFLMEQALGHISYARNLRRWLRRDESIDATVMPVRPFVRDFYQRLYRVSNWSVVASLRAREQVRRHGGPGAFDALLYHTQITTLFSLRIMRRVPTVVSLDATPFNMDDLAHAYDKRPSGDSKVAGLKYRWNAATFRAGAAITTWSAWAKESVVRDYGVAGEKVTVIPPGVD